MISNRLHRTEPGAVIHRTSEDGFTLLEVLIGMVIMTVGLLGLALMQGTSVQANNFANHFAQASYLAQMKVEDLASEPFYQTGEAPGSVQSDLVDGANVVEAALDETEGPGGLFTRTWTVTDVTDFSRQISVTVTWTDPIGGVRNLTYTTHTRGWGN